MRKQFYHILFVMGAVSPFAGIVSQEPTLQERIARLDEVGRIPDGTYEGRLSRIYGGRVSAEDVILIHRGEQCIYRISRGGKPMAELRTSRMRFSYFDIVRNRLVRSGADQMDTALPDRGFSIFFLSFNGYEGAYEPLSFKLSESGGLLEMSARNGPGHILKILFDSITNRPLRIDRHTPGGILYRTLRHYYYGEIRVVRGDPKIALNLADRTEMMDLETGVLYRLEFFSADLRPPEEGLFKME
jgi:hypothetical protein